jgi:hypothetical protein
MPAVRKIFWKALVLGMIPFILGAGLPQMDCRCAAAKGQHWCECCFSKADHSQPSRSPLKPCCQRRLASKAEAPQMHEPRHDPGCPTCEQFRNPKTGSCCSLKQADTPMLSRFVDAPNLDVALLWMPLPTNDSISIVADMFARQSVLSRSPSRLPLDRVIVFEHLLI